MKRIKMTIFKNILLAALFMMAILISSAGGAHADMTIAYTLAGAANSTVSCTSQNWDVIGSGIAVTNVTGYNTPQNPGINLPISSGFLSFTTAPMTGSSFSNGLGTWNFGSGGTFNVTGGIPAISALNSNNSALISGSFNNATVQEFALGQYEFFITGASLNATDNANIYNYYGLPSGATSSIAFELTFNGQNTVNNHGQVTGFTSLNTTWSGILEDAPTLTATPIPAAAYLFGSGLMGLAGIRRKIKN